jgi:transposase
MECFAGLHVSIDETTICVVDTAGEVLLTASVATDPATIAEVLRPFSKRLRRVGHEAGALSPWLQPALKEVGLPAVCLETPPIAKAFSRPGAAQYQHPSQIQRIEDFWKGQALGAGRNGSGTGLSGKDEGRPKHGLAKAA